MNRRKALRSILASAAGLLAIDVELTGRSLLSPSLAGTLKLDINDPRFSALQNAGDAVKIGNAIAPGIQNVLPGFYPMSIVRESESAVRAVAMECTHNGCMVGEFTAGLFTCPCHGSQFTAAGNVVRGPAELPLPAYTATLAGSIVTVTGLPGDEDWILTSVDSPSTPTTISLFQHYPNPVGRGRMRAEIVYRVEATVTLVLDLHDAAGRTVAVLARGTHKPGVYRRKVDTGSLSPGVYFLTLRAGSFVESKRLVVAR